MNRQKRVRSRSAAFTLVELLVVITIIGMLMSLLLPAVQAAREAGRRATCMNNQKNVTLAMMHFESSRKYFPGYLNGLTLGYDTPEDIGGGVIQTPVSIAPVSWVVTLLPYLERRDLSDHYQAFLSGTVTTPLAQFSETSLSVLLCPSDPPDNAGPNLSFVVNRGINGQDGTPAFGVCFDLSRVGNSRVSADYISAHDGTTTTLLVSESLLTPGGAADPASGTAPSPPHLQLIAANGTTEYFFRPISEWLDTANTTATADPLSWKGGDEKAIDGIDYYSRGELSLGFEWGALYLKAERSVLAMVSQQVNSRHGGIIVSSFCDGHQATISEDIDINTFKHLMTPDSATATAALDPTTLRGPIGILNERKY